MNAIVPATSKKPLTALTPLNRKADLAISVMLNAIEPAGAGYAIPFSAAPTADQAGFLRNRLAELDGYLRPANPAEVLAEIGALLMVMATAESTDEGAQRALLDAYGVVLAGVAVMPFRRACAAYLSGSLGDGRWAPKPGEILQATNFLALAAVEERGRIDRVLRARVLPPPAAKSRDQAMNHVRETLRQLRSQCEPSVKREPYRVPTMVEAQGNLDRMAREAIAPIRLSDEARRVSGLPQFEEQMD